MDNNQVPNEMADFISKQFPMNEARKSAIDMMLKGKMKPSGKIGGEDVADVIKKAEKKGYKKSTGEKAAHTRGQKKSRAAYNPRAVGQVYDDVEVDETSTELTEADLSKVMKDIKDFQHFGKASGMSPREISGVSNQLIGVYNHLKKGNIGAAKKAAKKIGPIAAEIIPAKLFKEEVELDEYDSRFVGGVSPKERREIERLKKVDLRKKTKPGQTKPDAKPSSKNEDVELDEMSAKAHFKKYQAKFVVPPIDRNRHPNREREGLEGPYRSRKNGRIFYYDTKAGKYYDASSDMYLEPNDVMESVELDEISSQTKSNYYHKASRELRAGETDKSKVDKRRKGVNKAMWSLALDKKGWPAHTVKKEDTDYPFELDAEKLQESIIVSLPTREKAMSFSSRVVNERLATASDVFDDTKVELSGMGGQGSPTAAHATINKILKQMGGTFVSTNEGPRIKRAIAKGLHKEDVELDETTTADPRIGKLNKKSRLHLSTLANAMKTTGGPHLDIDSVIHMTTKGLKDTLAAAKKARHRMSTKRREDLLNLHKALGEEYEDNELELVSEEMEEEVELEWEDILESDERPLMKWFDQFERELKKHGKRYKSVDPVKMLKLYYRNTTAKDAAALLSGKKGAGKGDDADYAALESTEEWIQSNPIVEQVANWTGFLNRK